MSFGFTYKNSSTLTKIEETLARSRKVVLESMELTKKTSIDRNFTSNSDSPEREVPILERIKELPFICPSYAS